MPQNLWLGSFQRNVFWSATAKQIVETALSSSPITYVDKKREIPFLPKKKKKAFCKIKKLKANKKEARMSMTWKMEKGRDERRQL